MIINKSIISLIIFIIITVATYFISIGSTGRISTVDFRSQFSFLSKNVTHSNYHVPCFTGLPLRVYMYDLPNRFNVAMLSKKFSGEKDIPVTAGNIPAWPRNSGLKQQHSVEYWLMASLLCENCTDEAVRVLDPDLADVFFVPFFSSLSFNTHGRNMTDPDTQVDKQLQVDILKFLRQSSYWQRTAGRDHVIPMHHPNAFRFLREEVNASILIVADFGRYSKAMSNLRKDVVAPYMHVMESFLDDDSPDPYNSRTTLLFFKGRTVRKSEGVVRAKLENILKHYEDVHYESSYATGESIKALRKISKEKWLEMWRRLKEVAHHYEYQYPPRKDDAVNMIWRQVRHKVPAERLSVHRARRLKVPDWWR